MVGRTGDASPVSSAAATPLSTAAELGERASAKWAENGEK